MAAFRALLVALVIFVNVASCSVAKPSATQAKWLDYELGAVIHFNMQTFNKSMKPGHVVSPDTFNPIDLSTDQWVQAAKNFGAKYVVLTLDHFSGFLLWPTSTNYNYSVKFSKWRDGKGDVAMDFVKSCRKYGLEHGFFFSVHKNYYMNITNFKAETPAKQKEYSLLVEAQFLELLGPQSPYKDPFYLWFDDGLVPGVSPNIGPLVSSLAGEAICDECTGFRRNQGLRWIGDEDGIAPLPYWYAYDGQKPDPLGKDFRPANCDTVVRQHYWFWHPNTENRLKSTRQLVQEYLTSVGHGCTLILDLNPNPSGLVPLPDYKIYEELGQAIRLLYSHVVMSVGQPRMTVGLTETWLFESPPLQIMNGSLVLMENLLEFGQLVERYEIAFLTTDGSSIHVEGSTIGHKRIHPLPLQLAPGNSLFGVSVTIQKLVTSVDDYVVLREVSFYDWNEAVEHDLV